MASMVTLRYFIMPTPYVESPSLRERARVRGGICCPLIRPSATFSRGEKASDHPHREIIHLVDRLAVHGEETGGGQDFCIVIGGGDPAFHRDGAVGRHDLAPVEPAVLPAQGNGFEEAAILPAPALAGGEL